MPDQHGRWKLAIVIACRILTGHEFLLTRKPFRRIQHTRKRTSNLVDYLLRELLKSGVQFLQRSAGKRRRRRRHVILLQKSIMNRVPATS